ncbi:hypothetical protein CYMTET_33819 [Cymbomonas tetramitiformis]|uniref:AIR9-like A9 domain-containing protein n=1 Tax=Cymbomonas tetramitiformis TaxID=36881 RepID=A0AAE0FCA6_9CHLO|nr:hypothetical protein CYMTET_33819 [Cymbomonas tetramitiformis]
MLAPADGFPSPPASPESPITTTAKSTVDLATPAPPSNHAEHEPAGERPEAAEENGAAPATSTPGKPDSTQQDNEHHSPGSEITLDPDEAAEVAAGLLAATEAIQEPIAEARKTAGGLAAAGGSEEEPGFKGFNPASVGGFNPLNPPGSVQLKAPTSPPSPAAVPPSVSIAPKSDVQAEAKYSKADDSSDAATEDTQSDVAREMNIVEGTVTSSPQKISHVPSLAIAAACIDMPGEKQPETPPLPSPRSPAPPSPEPSSSKTPGSAGVLPSIRDLTTVGKVVLGGKVMACGHHENGTDLCLFQWYRRKPEDTEPVVISGATAPVYHICADDIGTQLSVRCTPTSSEGKMGRHVFSQANKSQPIMLDAKANETLVAHAKAKNVSFEVVDKGDNTMVISVLKIEPKRIVLSRNGKSVLKEAIQGNWTITLTREKGSILTMADGKTLDIDFVDHRTRDLATIHVRQLVAYTNRKSVMKAEKKKSSIFGFGKK